MEEQKVKVAVGMSGGVDSSVSALLLKQAGYEVVGLFMKLWHDSCGTAQNACCDDKALADAHLIAKKIGIPLYEVDVREEFKEAVTDYFIDEYRSIRTPNPCVVCNKKIKFGWLLQFAEKLNCDYLATGHYARIVTDSVIASHQPTAEARQSFNFIQDRFINDGLPRLEAPMARNDKNSVSFHLLKGVDEAKDQSYFLYQLNQDQLSKIIFPVGGMTKPEVRKIAEENGLPVFEKAESQEVCFVSDNDYRAFLRRQLESQNTLLRPSGDEGQAEIYRNTELNPFEPGNIVDKDGNVIGKHEGLANYTIGQRKGINQKPDIKNQKQNAKIKNISAKYVVGFNVEKNELIIGDDEDLFKKDFEIENANWINDRLKVESLKLKVKIRYKAEAISCAAVIPAEAGIQAGKNSLDPRASLSSHIVEPEDDKEKNKFLIHLVVPARAITPGQSAVFYDGSEVIGGGIIIQN